MPFNIKFKVNIAFALTLLALGVMGILSIRASYSLKSKSDWVSHTHEVLETSSALRAHLGDAGAARRAAFQNDATQLANFDRATASASADLAILRQLVSDNLEQSQRLNQLAPLMRSRLTLQRISIEAYFKNKVDDSQQKQLNAQLGSLSTQFNSLLQEFESDERILLEQRSVEVEASDQRTTLIDTILACSALFFFILAVYFLNRELTRRAKAEKLVAEKETLLRSIFDASSDWIVVADSSGDVVLRNRAAARQFGENPPTRLEPSAPARLGYFKPDQSTLFTYQETPLYRTVHGENIDGLEMCVRREGRAQRWVLATGRSLKTADGSRNGGVVFYRDVTEQKESNALLQAAYLDAEAVAREKSQLGDLADLFQSCQALDEAYQIISSSLPLIFDERPGAVCLTNSSRNLTEVVARWSGCTSTESSFAPNDCWALRMGKLYEGGNPKISLKCSHVRAHSTAEYFCVPLMAQGETLGVLYLEHSDTDKDAFEEQRRALKRRANVVAERVSLALTNLRLREILRNQSTRDPLTGLFNRRYMEESMNRELRRAARKKRLVSVVMIDLDHFKSFNDRFGHQAGDEILREVAGVFRERARAGDLVCRFGGEEFALVLPETDHTGALVCLEDIRARIKALRVHHRGEQLGSVTISAGVAVYPHHGDSAEGLIDAADKALYTAKKTGRDRIIVSSAAAAPATSIPIPA